MAPGKIRTSYTLQYLCPLLNSYVHVSIFILSLWHKWLLGKRQSYSWADLQNKGNSFLIYQCFWECIWQNQIKSLLQYITEEKVNVGLVILFQNFDSSITSIQWMYHCNMTMFFVFTPKYKTIMKNIPSTSMQLIQ